MADRRLLVDRSVGNQRHIGDPAGESRDLFRRTAVQEKLHGLARRKKDDLLRGRVARSDHGGSRNSGSARGIKPSRLSCSPLINRK